MMKPSTFYLAFTAFLVVVSCNKTYNTTIQNDTIGTNDNILAEIISDDVTNMAGEVSENTSGTFNDSSIIVTSTSATITYDTANRIITIRFKGITCSDGHIRTGKLTFNYSQSPDSALYFRNPGFKMTVSDSAYTDNGNSLTIHHKSILNTTPIGFDSAITNETWVVTDTNTILKKGGGTITLISTKTKTLLNTKTAYHGKALPISWDSDTLGLNGSSKGIDSEGETYSAIITTTLVRNFSCSPLFPTYPAYHPTISGTATFTPGTKAIHFVNYGNGACDQQASITIYGTVYPITLP